MTLRVVVADDHPMFRDGLAAMLRAQPDMDVAACVGTGRDATAAATELQPDVAVLDMRMPDGDGVTATAAIRQASPETRILILTSFDEAKDVVAALTAGAQECSDAVSGRLSSEPYVKLLVRTSRSRGRRPRRGRRR